MAGSLTHIVAIIGLFVGSVSQPKVTVGGWQLQSTDVGKEYGVVRRNLIRESNVPVDQDHSSRVCFLSDTECSMYPELRGCAIDQGRPCRFEWQSASGVGFYVITTGEDPKNLIVRGMGYDEKVP
jgi:hypothetical protein